MASSSIAAIGRWLFFAGVFMMITGDSPEIALHVSRWDVEAAALAWPWLYLVLLGAGLAATAAGGRLLPPSVPRLAFLGWPLGLLVATFLLSTIVSRVPSLSIQAWLLSAGIVAFAWAVARLVEERPLLEGVLTAIAVGVILLAVRVIDWRLDEGLGRVPLQVLNNAWEGKLQLSWLFMLCAPLLLVRCVGATRWGPAVLHGLAWAGAAAATVLLSSRMAVLVLAATTASLCLLNGAYRRRMAGLLGGGLLVGLAVGGTRLDLSTFAPAALTDATRNPGITIRLQAWREALRIAAADPVAGAGLGTYDTVAYTLEEATADRAYRDRGWHAHNTFLHVLAETGTLGLFAWCALWGVLLARLGRAWSPADAPGRLAIGGALGVVAGFLLLSMTEVLVAARVHASLRMNLTIALLVVVGLRLALPDPHDPAGAQAAPPDRAPH